MRVTYRREGGMAYLPGLSRPLQLDTATMPPEQAARLEELVAAADLFKRKEPPPPPAGAVDIYRYTLQVQHGRRRRTLRLADPIAEAEMQRLVEYLEELRREGGRPAPEP